MFFWNSLALSMTQRMLAIISLVPLPFLKPAWCFKRTALKHVYYLGWNRSPAQVGCMRQVLGPGALGKPRGNGWRGRWEGGLGWGTHVNPWLFHFNVWQNPPQIKKKKKKKEKKMSPFFLTWLNLVQHTACCRICEFWVNQNMKRQYSDDTRG